MCVLAVSCVSLWASCHCWERLHSHVSHSRCFVLLVWSHSVLMSLSALFPFCTSTPCHTTPTTSTYRWESQSALCSVSVLHFATAALVKYTPWFFVQTTLQFISSLLSSLAICYFSCYFSYLKMGCAINPCSFPMEPLVKYCSFFHFLIFYPTYSKFQSLIYLVTLAITLILFWPVVRCIYTGWLEIVIYISHTWVSGSQLMLWKLSGGGRKQQQRLAHTQPTNHLF